MVGRHRDLRVLVASLEVASLEGGLSSPYFRLLEQAVALPDIADHEVQICIYLGVRSGGSAGSSPGAGFAHCEGSGRCRGPDPG